MITNSGYCKQQCVRCFKKKLGRVIMSKITTLRLGFSDAFLIQDKATIIVDTGINVYLEKYLEIFAKLDINPKEIGLIIISHGHADHYGNAHMLKELTGAPILCHKNAVKALQTGYDEKIIPRNELGESVFNLIKNKLPKADKTVEPDIVIDEEADLVPYGIRGKIIHTPGHSDCSISVILESGQAIVGDIMVRSPFTAKPCLAYFATDEKALHLSVSKLVKEAHIFFGGHGGPFTKDEALQME